MSTEVARYTFDSREAWLRFVCAGLATAIIDGLFSSILNVAAYGSTVSRLFQGVASTSQAARPLKAARARPRWGC